MGTFEGWTKATLEEQSAKLDQITCLRRGFGGQVWANLACLCVDARRQEDIGYGG